jgi:hypothetical protein
MARTLLWLALPTLSLLAAFAPLEAPAAPAGSAQPVDARRAVERDAACDAASDASQRAQLEAASCADCHAEIQSEWAASLHASAWTNESYQRALKRRKGTQRDACLPCHIPEPLGRAQLEPAEGELPLGPTTRTEDLHAGVSCATCHLGEDGAMLGPFGGATEAHASRRDARFDPERVDRLCLACHATEIGPVLPLGKDFLAAPPREPAASCVGCHMEPIERPMATTSPGGPNAPVRAGRRHALRGARDATLLAETLRFTALRSASGAVEFVVANTGAAHRTPGLVGRSWKFDVELSSAAAPAPRAKPSKPRKASFELRHDEALLPLAERRFALEPGELALPLLLRIRASYRLGGKEAIDLPVQEIEVR